MGSILDIDSSLNINNDELERYYTIGNSFKLTSIRNNEHTNKLKSNPRSIHDIWINKIFDVERVCSKSDDFNFANIFGDAIIYDDLRYALGIHSMEISPVHKFVLASLINTVYENSSVMFKISELKSQNYVIDPETRFFLEHKLIDFDLDENIKRHQRLIRGMHFAPVVVNVISDFDKNTKSLAISIPYKFYNGGYEHAGDIELYFQPRLKKIFKSTY